MTVIPHNSAQSVQVSVCSFLQVYHTAILLWLRNIYSDVLLMFLFSPCFCSVFVAVVQDTLPHAMCRLQLMGRASEHKIKGRYGSHVLETLLMCSQCVFFWMQQTHSIRLTQGVGRAGPVSQLTPLQTSQSTALNMQMAAQRHFGKVPQQQQTWQEWERGCLSVFRNPKSETIWCQERAVTVCRGLGGKDRASNTEWEVI